MIELAGRGRGRGGGSGGWYYLIIMGVHSADTQSLKWRFTQNTDGHCWTSRSLQWRFTHTDRDCWTGRSLKWRFTQDTDRHCWTGRSLQRRIFQTDRHSWAGRSGPRPRRPLAWRRAHRAGQEGRRQAEPARQGAAGSCTRRLGSGNVRGSAADSVVCLLRHVRESCRRLSLNLNSERCATNDEVCWNIRVGGVGHYYTVAQLEAYSFRLDVFIRSQPTELLDRNRQVQADTTVSH